MGTVVSIWLNNQSPWVHMLIGLPWIIFILTGCWGWGHGLFRLFFRRHHPAEENLHPPNEGVNKVHPVIQPRDSMLLIRTLELALGMGIAAQVLFSLGLIGGFSSWTVSLIAIGGVATGIWSARLPALSKGVEQPQSCLQNQKPAFPGKDFANKPAEAGDSVPAGLTVSEAIRFCFRPGWKQLLLFLLIIVLALFPLLFCLVPEVNFDALRDHLWLTRELVDTGHFPFDPQNFTTAYPNMSVPLFAANFCLAGETGAKVMHFALGFLTILSLVGLARQERKTAAGLAAAILLISLPVVAWEMSAAYVDLAGTLYSLLTLIALVRWRETANSSWVIIASIFLGINLTSKYHAFLWMPFTLVLIFILGRRLHLSAKQIVVKAFLFLFISLAVVSPWLIRNAANTGNPVFPIPVPGFRSALITDEMVQEDRKQQASFGFGRTITAFCTLPWNLSQHPERFRGGLGLLGFLALPLCLIFWRRMHTMDVVLFLAFVFWLVAWFITGQEIRYLLPAMPFWAWLAAFPLVGHLSQIQVCHQEPYAPRRALVMQLIWGTLIAGQILLHLQPFYQRRHPEVPFQIVFGQDELAVITGRISPAEYRSSKDHFYPVFQWANQNLAPPVRILSFYPAAYWSRWPMLYAFSVEGDFTGKEHDPAKIISHCHELKLSHVVVNMDWVTPGVDISRAPEFFKTSFQRSSLREIHREGPVILFAIPSPHSNPE